VKKQEYVTLENLGHGAAAEMFQAELARVVENVSDPNTKPEAVRSVTLKLKIKPNKDRTFCAVEISCDGKLASLQPFETQMYVGMDKGKGVATEYNPAQGNLAVQTAEGAVDVRTGQIVSMGGR
jgi:hypothetical protein